MASVFPLKLRPKGAQKKKKQPRLYIPRPSVQHGYVKSFDGTEIFYSIEGEGEPLVFCYGLVCSSLHWTYQIDYFRSHYKTIWFDYRGHHNSDTPNDLSSITIKNIAKDLSFVLEKLKIDNATLLGHSMGVNVALDFFHLYPEKVKQLVLMNGTCKRPLENLLHHNFSEIFFKLLAHTEKRLPNLVQTLWKLQKNNPLSQWIVTQGGFNKHLAQKEDVAQYINQIAEMDAKLFLQLINNYNAYDATPWLHQINVPTMILAGEQDHITPTEEQELLHQLIPNSQIEIIKHGSHCPQMDLPDLVNLLIDNFLKKNT